MSIVPSCLTYFTQLWVLNVYYKVNLFWKSLEWRSYFSEWSGLLKFYDVAINFLSLPWRRNSTNLKYNSLTGILNTMFKNADGKISIKKIWTPLDYRPNCAEKETFYQPTIPADDVPYITKGLQGFNFNRFYWMGRWWSLEVKVILIFQY